MTFGCVENEYIKAGMECTCT